MSRVNCLWSMILLCYSINSNILFEINRVDIGLKILIASNESGFCAFFDPGDGNLNILGDISNEEANSNLISITDKRWPLVYFLPRKAFLSFEDVVRTINPVIQGEETPKVTVSSQSGDEVMRFHNEMDHCREFQ